jgi:WD40 repeat protein
MIKKSVYRLFKRRYVFLLAILINVFASSAQINLPDLPPYLALTIQWDAVGDRYAVGYVNGDVRIFDENNNLVTEILIAHDGAVIDVAVSPDGDHMATGGEDSALRIWNVTTGELINAIPLDIGYDVLTVRWNTAGDEIFIATSDGVNRFVSADTVSDTYQITHVLNLAGHSNAVAWRPDDNVIAIGRLTTDLEILDALDYSSLRRFDVPRDSIETYQYTTSVVWHPTANIVATGTIDGQIYIWGLDSASDDPVITLDPLTYRYENIAFTGVKDISFLENGDIIQAFSADGTLRAWDFATGEIASDSNIGDTVIAAAFSPDGATLVYVTHDQPDFMPTLKKLDT